MAKISTLQDDFEFGGIDSGKWSATNGQVDAGDVNNLDLEISSILAGNYVSLNSLTTYDLTASSIFIQLTNAGNQSITSWEVYPIYLVADVNNKIFIRITGNTVQAIHVVANVTSNVGSSVAYNSTTMKWFRIRESGGTTFYEYAADPTGSWTLITSEANPITLTALTYEVLCGTWQAESSTTTAQFDNINVIPASLQFSWKSYVWNKRIHAGPPANNQTWSSANISGPDGNGYITLALTNAGSAPIGCEIFSANRSFGYGTYTMVVGTELDNISAAACFGGMFLFDFTAPPDYKEIDVNETRDYQQQVTKNILHSHVYNNGGSGTFITDSANYDSSSVQTHRMIWTPGKIVFDAFIGTGYNGTNYFHTVHATNIPVPGRSRVHFNTFVDVNITGFATVSPVNIVIRDFSFQPLNGTGSTTRSKQNLLNIKSL